MIANRFEVQTDEAATLDAGEGVSQIGESLQASFRERPEDYLWVDLPESSAHLQTGESEKLLERAGKVERRKQQDRARREALLTELRNMAEPPDPPVENASRDPGEGAGEPAGEMVSRCVRGQGERYRLCEACSGSGKKWWMLVCPRCRGLGSVSDE